MPNVKKLIHGLDKEEGAAAGAGTRRSGEMAPTAYSERPLRIMHVTNSMALGGTEKVTLRLATTLTDGFDHYICCIRSFDADLIGRWLRPEQFRALDLPQSRFAFFVPQLVRAIRAAKPDIVHSRNWGAIESVMAARLAGVPVVVHSEHGYEVDCLAATPLRQRWMRRLTCSLADAFFTVSRELRDFHAAQAGVRPERIRVVYNGVDTLGFAPNPAARARLRAENGIGMDDFVVGAVGRTVPIKDYKTLILAAALLARRIRNFKLLLVGDGPELSDLVALAESFPEMRSRLLTLGRRDDISDLLASMDVFAQTSLREGMSNTLLEAMATGLPPVVTRVGGNPEIVDHGRTGWLFTPGDADGLSQLLFMLAANHGLRADAGQAARQRIQQTFSQETMLASYRSLYLELARKRRLHRAVDWARAGYHAGENGAA